MALHATRIQASAETFMGFPDSAMATRGGLEELQRRIGSEEGVSDLITKSTVSTCAADARSLGLLRSVDQISMNPERLLGDAKDLALALVPLTRGESRPGATQVI
jgi:3-hydroxyacyl-CoA dehydrogenase